jgi:hypothetical protein
MISTEIYSGVEIVVCNPFPSLPTQPLLYFPPEGWEDKVSVKKHLYGNGKPSSAYVFLENWFIGVYKISNRFPHMIGREFPISIYCIEKIH